jgi:hypothetical protein
MALRNCRLRWCWRKGQRDRSAPLRDAAQVASAHGRPGPNERRNDLRGVVPARGRRTGCGAAHDRPRRLRVTRGGTEGKNVGPRRGATPARGVASHPRGFCGAGGGRCRAGGGDRAPVCGGRGALREMDSRRRSDGGRWCSGHGGTGMGCCHGTRRSPGCQHASGARSSRSCQPTGSVNVAAGTGGFIAQRGRLFAPPAAIAHQWAATLPTLHCAYWNRMPMRVI